jgi:hypothetical protein
MEDREVVGRAGLPVERRHVRQVAGGGERHGPPVPGRHPPGHPAQEPGRVAANPGGLPRQRQERRPGGVLGGVVVPQHRPADAPHHRGVPPHQQLEGGRVAVGGEPVQQLDVGRPVVRRAHRPLRPTSARPAAGPYGKLSAPGSAGIRLQSPGPRD